MIIITGIFLTKFDQKQTKFWVMLVCQKVKDTVLMVVNDLFDGWDLEFFVKIYLFLSPVVVVDTILHGGYNWDGLLVIHKEKFWLSWEGLIENYQIFNSFSFKI